MKEKYFLHFLRILIKNCYVYISGVLTFDASKTITSIISDLLLPKQITYLAVANMDVSLIYPADNWEEDEIHSSN